MTEFEIQNLDRFQQRLLKMAERDFPDVLKNILESLGEVMSGEAKEILRSKKTPHARYVKQTKIITRGRNAGKKKNYIKYIGTQNTNSIDTGALWNSLSRGGASNVWVYSSSSGNFVLNFGTSLNYAKYVNNGYTSTPHWVPGTVNSNGKFQYQPGAKTGIYVKGGTHKGIQFFEIAFEELEKVAPDIIKDELVRFANEFNRA